MPQKQGLHARRPVVYHIMLAGRRHVTAASKLIPADIGPAVELDPAIVCSSGVVLPIEARKLRTLDEEGWVYAYPDVLDRRGQEPRRTRQQQKTPPRTIGRRSSDKGSRTVSPR
jgi:hypothetical protein